jgi:hypothetical protein
MSTHVCQERADCIAIADNHAIDTANFTSARCYAEAPGATHEG